MTSKSLHALLVVVLIMSAGCSGLSTQSTPSESSASNESTLTPTTTATAAPGPTVEIVGDELPVDAGQTYRRVQGLLGTNETSVLVSVERVDGTTVYGDEQVPSGEATLFTILADENRTVTTTVAGNADPVANEVSIRYTSEATTEEVEQTLAHEFAHVLQPDRYAELARRYEEPRSTTDRRLTTTSLVEGGATYVESQYTDQFLPDTATRQERLAEEWQTLTSAEQRRRAPYRFGARYVARQVSSPTELDSVYETPPTTTEQVLHGYAADKPSKQSPIVESEMADSPWGTPVDSDVKGELYLRLLLSTRLPDDAAASAAAGWGGDRVVTYRTDANVSYGWVLTWDDAANATEFERGLETFLDYRTEAESDSPSVNFYRIDDTTVGVLVGSERFTERVTFRRDNSTVVVEQRSTS